MKESDIKFEYIGIAEALFLYNLIVPTNQRDFAWETEDQVQEYLQDIAHAISRHDSIYFLGTLMLIEKNGALEVADGQQRLATTCIILSIIRDILIEKNDLARAKTLETEYLYKIDFNTADESPKLTLNNADNEFFRNTILLSPERRTQNTPKTISNKLLFEAAKKIKTHFENRRIQLGEDHFNDEIKTWVEYLRKNVKVIAVKVSSEEYAFLLFETMNDRGMDVTAADLVKNFLFQKSENRLSEAQNAWSVIKSSIESVTNKKSLIMEFLRYACCIRHGQTTDREVFSRIKSEINSKSDTMMLVTFYQDLSIDYAEIRSIYNEKWKDYDIVVRKSIEAINILGVKQIKPLMLAIAKFFPKTETAIAFRKMVSWSVRFLIADVKGGRLDLGYSTLSNQIFKGEIKTAEELKLKSENFMISDSEFRSAFANANVSVGKLARYYLRSLETTARDQKEPEFIPNESTEITLEHIMPTSLDNGWNDYIKSSDIDSHHTRIGNMVLLQATKNLKLGSSSYEKKKAVYKKSAFLLTSHIADSPNWNIDEIENRQKIMAELAVKTWAL